MHLLVHSTHLSVKSHLHIIYIISASSLQAHLFNSSEASAAVHDPAAATATAAPAFTPCGVADNES